MKKLVSLVLIAAMVFCLTACGGKKDPEEGKSREGDKKATEAPTPTDEPTPTAEPTATPTPEPAVGIEEGPAYAIAAGDGCDFYSDLYTGEGTAFESDLDYLYITEEGYDDLARAVRSTNHKTYRAADELRSQVRTILESETNKFDTQWYKTSRVKVCRNDEELFAFTRTDESYLGALTYKSREGFLFDTKTGEPVTLGTLISDMDGFTNDIIVSIQSHPSAADFNENWKEVVREGIADGTVGYVATADGLEIWYNSGAFAPYSIGEICVSYNALEYASRFSGKYAKVYLASQINSRVKRTALNRDEAFINLIRELSAGLGKLSWSDTKEILDRNGIQYEGLDDREAEECEMQAYFKFYNAQDDYIYLFYWQDGPSFDSTQRLSQISVNLKGMENFMIICDMRNANEDGSKTYYEYVDCSFEDTGSRDGAYFDNIEDLLRALYITTPLYYSDVVLR